MPAKRLWYFLILSFAALLAATPQADAQDTQDAKPADAATLVDFQILAIAPVGDETDYKLVPVGETKIDPAQLATVAKARSRGFLNLGIGERDYDGAAELSQCRAACKANTRCHDIAYSRPTKDQPLGVCRLKTAVEAKPAFGVMTPITEALDQTAAVTPKTTPTEATAAGATIAETPPTVTFEVPKETRPTPVTSAAAPTTADPTAQPVVTTPIRPAEAVPTADIAAIEDIPPPPELPAVDVERFPLPPRAVIAEAAATEQIPPADLPPITVEPAVMPPRAIATDAPTDITTPPPIEPEPEMAEAEPAPVAAIPEVEEQPAAKTDVEPTPLPKRGLPWWLALGAVAAMFGGAGAYWRNHRARMLTRLSTRLVSNGLDRQTISIENVEFADLSLRFVVRKGKNAATPPTEVELIPKGAVA